MSSYDLILKKEDKKIVLEYASIKGEKGEKGEQGKPLGIASTEILKNKQTKIVFDDEKGTTLLIPPGKDGYTPVKGKDYSDGEDGTSPIINTEPQKDKVILKITDKEGEKEVEVPYGKDGYTPQKGVDYFDGEDGVSPTIETENQVDGYLVTLTDKEGEHSFKLLHGKDGEKGDSLKVTKTEFDKDGNTLVTLDDKYTFTVEKGKRGDPAKPLTIKNQSFDDEGNTLITFSDDTEVTIKKGKDGSIDISTWTEQQKEDFRTQLDIPEPDLTPYAKLIDLENKADKIHTHTIDNIDKLQYELNKKANSNHVHSEYATKDELENIDVSDQLEGKADKVHKHSISDISNLQSKLDEKQAKGDYALKSDIPNVDLSGKADINHKHYISDVTGLQSALDGKASTSHTHSEYASKNHSHSAYVEKTYGKGLSTNDYTNTAKKKVDAIPTNPKYTDTTYKAGSGLNLASGSFNLTNTFDNSNIKIWIGSQSDYDYIAKKDPKTLYFIEE